MNYIIILIFLFLLLSCNETPKADYNGYVEAVNKRYEAQKKKAEFEMKIRLELLRLGINDETADRYIDFNQ